jgi:N6-adenosine-specific RNA methylase IME4
MAGIDMKIHGLKVHPAANLFPLLDGNALDELAADIGAHGLREKVVMYEGMILDGRNRARACKKANVKVQTRNYGGKDPLGFVVSLNLARRHLTESQRAMVAAKLVETTHGGDRRSSGKSAGRTQAEAASEVNSSTRSVRQAQRVMAKATPELVSAVESGHVAVSLAEKILSLPVKEQLKVAREAVKGGNPVSVVRELNRQQREAKMVQIKSGNKALPVDKKYGVILADPPWMYDEGTTTPNRKIENHYPPMPIDEICALPVRKLGLKHSLLVLNIPSPLLFEYGPRVLKAWGFCYKSGWVWHKTGRRGMGYWAQCNHEHILLCPRGDVPPPTVEARFPSVFDAPVGKHSEKPIEIHRRIELMYPKASKIELFSRQTRKGWDAWGNQAT